MFQKLVVLTLVSVAVGCDVPPAGPMDKPLQAEAALASIWKSFGVPGKSVPVYGVDPDPRCKPAIGIFDSTTRSCHLAVTQNRESVWLTLPPAGLPRLYSTSLPHEAMHVLGYKHEGQLDWDPESMLGKLVKKAEDNLLAQPDINRILVVGEVPPEPLPVEAVTPSPASPPPPAPPAPPPPPQPKSICRDSLVHLLDVGEGISVNGYGQALFDQAAHPNQKILYVGVRKLNLWPGGEYDFDVVVEVSSVRTEAKIVGVCE